MRILSNTTLSLSNMVGYVFYFAVTATSVWFDAAFSQVEDGIRIVNCGNTTASRYVDVSAPAEQSYDARFVEHPGCAATSNPAKCCAECQAASKEYFESRDWLCAQGLELLRS